MESLKKSLKYFAQIPDFRYISQLDEDKDLVNSYISVKNLFRRVKIREDIFSSLVFFTNYDIVGDERPDQVAKKIYNDESLDWVVLISNNILNVRDEWPTPQRVFDEYLLEKYKTYDNLYSVKCYKTVEVRDSIGNLVLPKGLDVDSDYSIKYLDAGTNNEVVRTNITYSITNYEDEEEKENNKRNIFLLKPEYLAILLNDIKSIMAYKKGSSQFVTKTLLKADNPNFFTY